MNRAPPEELSRTLLTISIRLVSWIGPLNSGGVAGRGVCSGAGSGFSDPPSLNAMTLFRRTTAMYCSPSIS